MSEVPLYIGGIARAALSRGSQGRLSARRAAEYRRVEKSLRECADARGPVPLHPSWEPPDTALPLHSLPPRPVEFFTGFKTPSEDTCSR